MERAFVVGLGKSGLAAAALLRAQGYSVVISDSGDSEALRRQQAELAKSEITVRLSDRFNPDVLLDEMPELCLKGDEPFLTPLVVVSPGVPWNIPGLVTARDRGWRVVGELAYAWQQLRDRSWLCVTGTNGKTTTTALLDAIFKAAGYPIQACGNIGYAACELAYQASYGETGKSAAASNSANRSTDSDASNWVLAELSSYQIEAGQVEAKQSISPHIGIWTTLTPDHLSRHKTVENYAAIKASLLHQSEMQLLNGDDPYLRNQAATQFPEAYWTNTQGLDLALAPLERTIYLEDGWVKVAGEAMLEASSLRMHGQHNLQNLLLAVGAAHLAGVEKAAIAQAIREFPGVPHRLEQVARWRDIAFINDSKATNYDAAEVGLAAMTQPTILIAGGAPKEGDDSAWIAQIQRQASAVLLIGDAAPQFAQRMGASGVSQLEVLPSLTEAVPRAAQLAQTLGAKVVLLSPACASFDQYANFEQRGEDFRQLSQAYCDSHS